MTRVNEKPRDPASYSAEELLLVWQATAREMLYGPSYKLPMTPRFVSSFEKAREYFVRENLDPERYVWAVFDHARYVCSVRGVSTDDVLRDAANGKRCRRARMDRSRANKRAHAAEQSLKNLIIESSGDLMPAETRKALWAASFSGSVPRKALRGILLELRKARPSLAGIATRAGDIGEEDLLGESIKLSRFISNFFFNLKSRALGAASARELLAALGARDRALASSSDVKRSAELHRASRGGLILRPRPEQLTSGRTREIYDRWEERAKAEPGHDEQIHDRAPRSHASPDVRDFLAVQRSAELYPVVIGHAAGTHPDGVSAMLQGLSPLFLFFLPHPLAQRHVANGGASPEQRRAFNRLQHSSRERSRAKAIYDGVMRGMTARGEFEIR